jgi:hypothetical protein
MFERTGKHKKKQKNIFFNYFLIYLVAIIVIIALYTKNIILIIRCRINRNCFDIYSEIKLDGLSFEIFFTIISCINIFFSMCVAKNNSFSDCMTIGILLILSLY